MKSIRILYFAVSAAMILAGDLSAVRAHEVDLDCPESPGSVPQSSRLIAYYPLDGNTADVSGNDMDAVEVVAVEPVEGKIGQGYYFNGKDSYIRLPLDISPYAYPQITITAWIKPEAIDQTRYIVNQGDHANRGLFIYNNAVSAGRALIGDRKHTVYAGRWTFVALTYDQTTNTAVLLSDVTISAVEATVPEQPIPSVLLGAKAPGNSGFAGIIDEVRVYADALTVAELAAVRKDPGRAAAGTARVAAGAVIPGGSTSPSGRSISDASPASVSMRDYQPPAESGSPETEFRVRDGDSLIEEYAPSGSSARVQLALTTRGHLAHIGVGSSSKTTSKGAAEMGQALQQWASSGVPLTQLANVPGKNRYLAVGSPNSFYWDPRTKRSEWANVGQALFQLAAGKKPVDQLILADSGAGSIDYLIVSNAALSRTDRLAGIRPQVLAKGVPAGLVNAVRRSIDNGVSISAMAVTPSAIGSVPGWVLVSGNTVESGGLPPESPIVNDLNGLIESGERIDDIALDKLRFLTTDSGYVIATNKRIKAVRMRCESFEEVQEWVAKELGRSLECTGVSQQQNDRWVFNKDNPVVLVMVHGITSPPDRGAKKCKTRDVNTTQHFFCYWGWQFIAGLLNAEPAKIATGKAIYPYASSRTIGWNASGFDKDYDGLNLLLTRPSQLGESPDLSVMITFRDGSKKLTNQGISAINQVYDQYQQYFGGFDTQPEIVFVGHSFGGIVSRFILNAPGQNLSRELVDKATFLRERTRYIITVATPHDGSPISDMAMQMGPDGEKLADEIAKGFQIWFELSPGLTIVDSKIEKLRDFVRGVGDYMRDAFETDVPVTNELTTARLTEFNRGPIDPFRTYRADGSAIPIYVLGGRQPDSGYYLREPGIKSQLDWNALGSALKLMADFTARKDSGRPRKAGEAIGLMLMDIMLHENNLLKTMPRPFIDAADFNVGPKSSWGQVGYNPLRQTPDGSRELELLLDRNRRIFKTRGLRKIDINLPLPGELEFWSKPGVRPDEWPIFNWHDERDGEYDADGMVGISSALGMRLGTGDIFPLDHGKQYFRDGRTYYGGWYRQYRGPWDWDNHGQIHRRYANSNWLYRNIISKAGPYANSQKVSGWQKSR